MKSYQRLLALLTLFFITNVTIAAEQWMQLPATPTLPQAVKSGYAPINGIRVWYSVFGQGTPVILLHGALANSNYWGFQVPELAKKYQVIVMDSRGHGRSTRDDKPQGYHLMASDVLALMDYLKIKKAAIVGWSDGGIIGLDLAIHHPERISKLFAFGANSNPDGVLDISKSPVITAVLERVEKEYSTLSPTPDQYQSFHDGVFKMMETQPNFTKAQLNSIKVPTWIVDGDHEEAIKPEDTTFMAHEIPHAKLVILPNVSHFAHLQDPTTFNQQVLRFMEQNRS